MINQEFENRTLDFSKNILDYCESIKVSDITRPIINQLIRSATSIGANYHEANGSSSKTDFRNKIHICKKEAKETKYWLELLQHQQKDESISPLINECQEFILIFGKITGTLAGIKNK